MKLNGSLTRLDLIIWETLDKDDAEKSVKGLQKSFS